MFCTVTGPTLGRSTPPVVNWFQLLPVSDTDPVVCPNSPVTAYDTSADASCADPPPLSWMPAQSPAAGLPVPVAPPTLLSLTEVNTTGLAAVPAATSAPSTVMFGLDWVALAPQPLAGL